MRNEGLPRLSRSIPLILRCGKRIEESRRSRPRLEAYVSMEAVAAVSSIAGIISLTIQGLQLIEKLKVFCAGLDGTETQLFVKDLITSARILLDVKNLCKQIQDAESLAPMGGFRLASLQLQVEECTTDLQGWLDLTQRPNKFGVPERTRYKLARMYMEAVTKNTRGDLRKRFRSHQENMKIALSMLGR